MITLTDAVAFSSAHFGAGVGPIHLDIEDDLTDDQQEWLSLNAELSRDWPVLTEKKDAPEDAGDWENVEGKIQYLER